MIRIEKVGIVTQIAIHDLQIDMVEDVVSVLLFEQVALNRLRIHCTDVLLLPTHIHDAGVLSLSIRRHRAAHRKAGLAHGRLLVRHPAECDRHVVDDPMMLIIQHYATV